MKESIPNIDYEKVRLIVENLRSVNLGKLPGDLHNSVGISIGNACYYLTNNKSVWKDCLKPMPTFEEFISSYSIESQIAFKEFSGEKNISEFNDLVREFNDNLEYIKANQDLELLKNYEKRFREMIGET